MKKFVFISVFIFALCSCATLEKGNLWSPEYEKDLAKIQYYRRGETKKQYAERYERERYRLQHEHFHHNGEGLPIACNTCTICAEEINEMIATREAEERRKEEARLAEIKRREEARLAEIKRWQESLAKERADYENMESLRQDFLKKNEAKINKAKKDLTAYNKKIAAEVNRLLKLCKSYENQRWAELDALERQYTGRLNGECFARAKEKLDNKWKYKIASVEDMIPEEKALSSYLPKMVDEFNKELQAHGYSHRIIFLSDLLNTPIEYKEPEKLITPANCVAMNVSF